MSTPQRFTAFAQKLRSLALIVLTGVATAFAHRSLSAQSAGHYANVNGLRMYYEVEGHGLPLVLIHGGGSTIGTTFGRIRPLLAKNHRIIAVELQAHGHTSDRDAPESFAQDADDVAALLGQLKIEKADVFGFSNGGHTAMELAMSHPECVRKVILASEFYLRSGVDDAFWQSIDHAKFTDMPQAFKDAYLAINHDSAALLNMFHKDVVRMQTFKDWSDADVHSIQAPALVVIGDRDVTRPEHAVAMYRLLPHGRLVILPGTHGSYFGEAAASTNPNSKIPALFVGLVDEFLAAPM